MEHPENPNNGEQFYVNVLPETLIVEQTASGIVPRTLDDLQAGMRIAVSFAGGIAASYPGQGTAAEITILRTLTDGPTDPNDLVTMTFQFSVFGVADEVAATDVFYLAYAEGADDGRHVSFCGDGDGMREPCRDGGGTYLRHVKVPRGSELTYTVHRVSGGGSAEPQVVESGREIMDLNLSTQSHYRYGAANPGGYD